MKPPTNTSQIPPRLEAGASRSGSEPIAQDEIDKAKIAQLVAQAEAARDRHDWTLAETLYRELLVCDPALYGHQVQHGHTLRIMERYADAEIAYRAATEGEDVAADAFLHLGHVLRMQDRRADATEAYARSLALDPSLESARIELVNSGNRHRLPRNFFGRTTWRDEVAQVVRKSHDSVEAVRAWAGVLAYPVDAWDAFRNTFPIRPPHAPQGTAEHVRIVVDCGDSSPARMRATLMSLADQTHRDWRCTVLATPKMATHSVASFGHVDDRVTFVAAESSDGYLLNPEEGWLLSLTAGGALHPLALTWLLHAACGHDAVAAYADEDEAIVRPAGGRYHTAAYLREAFDLDSAATQALPPRCLIVSSRLKDVAYQAMPLITASGADEWRRALSLAAAAIGGVSHVPRVLHTTIRPGSSPDIVRSHSDARTSAELEPLIAACAPDTRVAQALAVLAAKPRKGMLSIVIPTRDEADALTICIESLIRYAAHPDLLDIIVVDNRSRERATADLLERLAADRSIRAITMDEPFNWSRVNNVAAEFARGDHLLFMNNDMEMITTGWDDRLRTMLSRDDIGVVGAKLLYSDMTVQHAGVVLGVDRQGPVHEGLLAPRSDPGPSGRWSTTRAAAAVTGAFMAVRRDVFEAMKGFDERNFFVVYNDIDFCMRVREAGLTVIYDPKIEVIHYESKTRGNTIGDEAIEWDAAELDGLHRRWGQGLERNMGYNPQWSLWSIPFDGYREPTDSEIETYITKTARANPWVAERDGR